MHQLTIIDHSGDTNESEALLFRTEAGARGHAARKGRMGGYLEYRLDGKAYTPVLGDGVHERPAGYRNGGKDFLYAEEA